MDALSAFLASLGPWGILIGAALPILAQFLRNRIAPAPAPVPPAPVPEPKPVPKPSDTPVLDLLLLLLKSKLAPKSPVSASADLSHDDAAELLLRFFDKPPAPPK